MINPRIIKEGLLLWIGERALGLDHSDLADRLNNLAMLYEAQGDNAKAEPLHKRAMAIWKKEFGPGHTDVAESLQNRAANYLIRNDFAKAEPLFKRALAIWEEALGPDHPKVAESLNWLAGLYAYDFSQAEPLYKRSLAIKEKALGPDHPDVAVSLHNLAFVYRHHGGYAQAESLYKRTLAIREKVLGPDHLDVAESLGVLGGLYQSGGDYAKAEPLYKRSLEIFETEFGPDHPQVHAHLMILANLYRETNRIEEAEKLERLLPEEGRHIDVVAHYGEEPEPLEIQFGKNTEDSVEKGGYGSEGTFVGEFLHSFYRSPKSEDEIVSFIRAVVAGGYLDNLSSQNTFAPFLAVVFSKYPDRAQEWASEIENEGARTRVMELSQSIDSLLDDPPSVANNDECWGAYFASGDKRFVDKLVETTRHVSSSSNPNLMLAADTAKWSLASNAEQHPLVWEAIESAVACGREDLQELLTEEPEVFLARMRDTYKAIDAPNGEA